MTIVRQSLAAVRFVPEGGRIADVSVGPLRAPQRQIRSLMADRPLLGQSRHTAQRTSLRGARGMLSFRSEARACAHVQLLGAPIVKLALP
jgi:hypothetical protein